MSSKCKPVYLPRGFPYLFTVFRGNFGYSDIVADKSPAGGERLDISSEYVSGT